jgi:hypothetical protein
MPEKSIVQRYLAGSQDQVKHLSTLLKACTRYELRSPGITASTYVARGMSSEEDFLVRKGTTLIPFHEALQGYRHQSAVQRI